MGRSLQDDTAIGSWRREPSTVLRRAATGPSLGAVSDAQSHVIFADAEAPAAPTEWEPHSHPMHELVWIRGGTQTTRVEDRIFTISEGSGLWLPAGLPHAGRLTAGVELFNAFFAPDRSPVAFDQPTVIAMTPVLESLLAHLSRTDLAADARARAETVVFDVLEPSQQPLALRLPGDPRIDAIAEALLADPADQRSLDDWARELEISDRTITRAFRSSTGFSFVQWRRVLRVHQALTLLSEGSDVQNVSERLGYAQPSTFIAAFRRELGTTPGVFLDDRRGARRLSEKPYRWS